MNEDTKSDSIARDFTAKISEDNPNHLIISSAFEIGKKYELTVPKNTVTSYYEVLPKSYQFNFEIDKAENYGTFRLILMNKPDGFICSHNDAGSLIYSLIPQRWNRRNPKISTVGRLDVDTTGAIILTDNGDLNHRLTSPKSDVIKVYEATLAEPLKGDEAQIFASGELMLNGEKKPLLPAKLEVITSTQVRLEIVEGKYHQVKRMFAAVGNRVVKLHRLNFAGFEVEDLKEGEYKFIEL